MREGRVPESKMAYPYGDTWRYVAILPSKAGSATLPALERGAPIWLSGSVAMLESDAPAGSSSAEPASDGAASSLPPWHDSLQQLRAILTTLQPDDVELKKLFVCRFVAAWELEERVPGRAVKLYIVYVLVGWGGTPVRSCRR